MPQIFKMGEYYIYFWTNENDPLEPIFLLRFYCSKEKSKAEADCCLCFLICHNIRLLYTTT